jgi:DNA-binding MarR family transcriptional regulator
MADRHEVLVELLQAVNKGMFDQVKDLFDKYGFPAASMMIMHQIRDHHGLTVSEVSRRSGLAKSHVSKTIDGLVEQGIVEKRPDMSDQRLVRLYTTDKATQHFGPMRAEIRQRLSALVSRLPEEKVDSVVDGLLALKSVLSSGKDC